MSVAELKPKAWYIIAGRGPMRFRECLTFQTFNMGYNYYASASEVVREATQEDLDKLRDWNISNRPPMFPTHPTVLQVLRSSRNLTTEQMSDLVIAAIDAPTVPGFKRQANPKFWNELLKLLDLQRYGIETQLGYLIDASGIELPEED